MKEQETSGNQMARTGRTGDQNGLSAAGRRGLQLGAACAGLSGIRAGGGWARPSPAYNRISRARNTVHSNIYQPDLRRVVVDESLLRSVNVTAGLKADGAVIINSSRSPDELRPLLGGYTGRVCTVNASRISRETLGGHYPNTPMLAAAVKVSQVVEPEQFIADMAASLRHKFAAKPHMIDSNLRALTVSMEEVMAG